MFATAVENQQNGQNDQNKISIAWRNLRFEVKQFGLGKRKPILRRLNGFFQINSLNALMGPSGAGKTTLLNCLSGNTKSGLTVDSEIYLNKQNQSLVSYFIEQHVHESIVGELTVGQILRYAFQFKNGLNQSKMTEHIEQTIKELMLPLELLDRPFQNCSGGEQKRVAIAQELMSLKKPHFLFIDEPTTGLDSCAATEVVNCLQKLTKSYQMTIIASIHAPNNETLSLFDKLYVLAKGGVCIYSGPPCEIKPYLEKEIKVEIPKEQPPIEALLKNACGGTQDPNVVHLANHTLTSEHAQLIPQLPNLSTQPNGIPSTRRLFSVSNFVLQLARQSRITFLAKYTFVLTTTFIYLVYFTIMSSLFSSKMAAATGCYSIAEQANLNCTNKNFLHEDSDVKQNTNYLAYVIIMIGFIVMVMSTIQFSSYIKVFRSEHRNYWYSLGTFFWSSNIIFFLEVSLQTIIITILSYFLSNQQLADLGLLNLNRFGHYFFFLWLYCMLFQALGQLIGIAFVNHFELAVAFCQIAYASSCLFNGLYVQLDRVGNELMVQIANWIGFVHISRGIFYSIYGIGRCDAEREYSWVLIEYNIDVNKIGEYAIRVLVNIVVLRLVTFVLMYFKFNNFESCSRKRKLEKSSEAIPIDWETETKANQEKTQNNVIELKEEKEVNFNDFSRGKIIIAWRNLSLYGNNSLLEMGSNKLNNLKPILRNLNGQFRFGTLNALMGTSGAGKTSLLKVLNGRCKTRLSDETEFYLSKYTKISTCFITQEVSGHLMPGLTAKQMLIYASKLKNPEADVDHEKIALGLLSELDLMNTVQTKVDQCSGGERKRLALALELTSRVMPNLVCIDEPTSGLDSNSAEIVISCLRKLVQSHPITIIASIHQPTAEILFMFDQLYVLARGGVCIYSGPPNEIQLRLNELSQSDTSKTNFPIETLIKHSCSNHLDQTVQQLAQLNNLQYKQTGNTELTDQTVLIPDGVVRNRQRFSLHSVTILSLRFASYIRGYLWKEMLFNLLNYIGYAYAVGLIYRREIIYPSGCLNPEDDYNNSCTKTAQQIEDEFMLTDNVRYNFFYTNIYLFLLLLASLLNFYREFTYFENEHRNGWYSSGSFYLMKSLSEIIPLLPLNLVYVYLIDIFDPVVPFGMYWHLVYLLTIGAIGFQGMAHCFTLLSGGNYIRQTVIMICFYLLMLMIGNFYIPVAEMHYVYQFLSNFSIPRWVFEPVMLLQYGFGRCRPKEIQSVLYSMNIEDEDYNKDLLMLVLNTILYRVLAVCLLIWRANPIENRRKRVTRIAKYREKLDTQIGAIPGIEPTGQEFRIQLSRV